MIKGFYVLTDNQGSYIREDKLTKKYVPVRSLKQAKVWDSKEKATSILKNSIGKTIRNKYVVKLIETEVKTEVTDTTEKKEHTNVKSIQKLSNNAPKEILTSSIEEDQIEDWLNKINQIVNVMSGSETRKKELLEKLSNIDKQIVDVEHYIEFNNFNAAQGWGCYKMLQTLLKQRRNYKHELQVIRIIEQSNFKTDSLSHIAERIELVKNQSYVPRVLTELFDNKK